MIFVFCGYGAAMAICAFAMVRNEWTFRQVRAFHREAFDRSAAQWWALGRPTSDDLCVGYNAIFRRFWVWDREAFRVRSLPPSDTNGGVA